MKSLTSEQMRRRWLALGVVALAYILSFFQRFAPAGVAPDLASAFQTSAASLGVLAATYFYVYTLMQIPTGILADTLGPRRILAVGGIVAGTGSFLFGLAPTLAMAQATGWRGVFIGVGVASLVLAALCWLIVRDAPESAETAIRPHFDRTAVLTSLLSVVRNRDTWPAVWVNTGMTGAFFTFAGLWATPYLMQVHGMARPVATAHLSLWFGGFAVGCFFIGGLSDRLGRRKPVMIAASHLYGAIWLVWLSCVTMPLAVSYALFALMGLSTAGFSLTWACAKEVNPPLLSGMSTSVANMGGFLAAALLQPFVGWVMDLGWRGETVGGARVYDVQTWQHGVLVVTVCAILGAVAAWWVRETRCRNIWKASC